MERIGLAAALLGLLLLPTTASASDGAIELSQTCAVNTGCLAGDGAGFPVTIGAMGSYVLTSDLVVPDENTTGITISASDVTINLNGFAIIQQDCVGALFSSCATAGIGDGITFTSLRRGVSVFGGSVVGMGDVGVSVPDQSRVSDVRVRWNQDDGIVADPGSTVEGCLAYENGDVGILSVGGVLITGNTTRDNGGDGINGGLGAMIVENVSNNNDGDGIRAGDTVDDVSYVRENIVRSNVGFGLDLEATTPYIGNVVDNNTAGTVNNGLPLGVNACDGTGSCP